MAGVGYCLGRVLASDSDDVCLPLLTTGSCCTVGRKEHCARPNGRTHLGWATHLLAYNMRQMDQIIFAKHLWKTSYLVSLYMNQPERRHRTYRIWRALCASVFWAPGPPHSPAGAPEALRPHHWVQRAQLDHRQPARSPKKHPSPGTYQYRLHHPLPCTCYGLT